MMKNKLITLSLLTISCTYISIASAAKVELRILETTDIHGYYIDFDYFKNATNPKYGLVRVANLIKETRSEVKNSILVDNGDLLQGNPLADFIANNPDRLKNDIHPAYKLMNDIKYDVGNIGNHEFNFGLDFLELSLSGAKFPYINANIYDIKTKKNYFTPYVIIDKKVFDTDGEEHNIKIGYIGFTPPQIMIWDRKHLEGKVYVEGIIETANKFIPEMKSKGADIIIAIPHSGLAQEIKKGSTENATYGLSLIKNIDAIMFGHAHAVFPSKTYSKLEGVDLEKGTINGIASVMPGMWGSHLGVVDLVLDNSSGKWNVVDSRGFAKPIFDKKPLVERDEELANKINKEHNDTIKYVNQKIGKIDNDIYSYLSLIQSDPTVEIINKAQTHYVKKYIQGDPNLENLPILSASAPFKAGGRNNAPDEYIEVHKGDITIRNAADLYLYPNTLTVVKVKGSEVIDWLECSAGMFNTIDPNSTELQQLFNWNEFRTYNFDIISGITYEIDITKPSKFSGACKPNNLKSNRISNVKYNGKPIDLNQDFLIASNNYRAYGGSFPGTGIEKVVIASPDENRAALIEYIISETKNNGIIKTNVSNNWKFKKIDSKVNLNIQFESSPNEAAKKYILKNAVYPIEFIRINDIGFGVYKIKLN